MSFSTPTTPTTQDLDSSIPTIDSSIQTNSSPNSTCEPSGRGSEEKCSVEELVKKDTGAALEAKCEGNEHFAKQRFAESIQSYSRALLLSEDTDTTNRAVFYSNRAAAHLMLDECPAVVSDCTECLKLVPRHPKALSRRARAYHKLDKFQEAIADLELLISVEPNNIEARHQLETLNVLQKEKTEKLKDEVVEKVKGLANSILGKFNLSTDNFKAQKDPITGSYSISFQK